MGLRGEGSFARTFSVYNQKRFMRKVQLQEESLVYSESLDLYASLRRFDLRLVLAESCTAGLVAAELGGIPGVSSHFCGSLVVYRNDSKMRWLGIEPKLLEDPGIGPVSEQVTIALAVSALAHTPEAHLAGAITGHLGPLSPAHLDGTVYCAVASHDARSNAICKRFLLQAPSPTDIQDIERRRLRQAEAARHLIATLIEFIERENNDNARNSKTSNTNPEKMP